MQHKKEVDFWREGKRAIRLRCGIEERERKSERERERRW